MYSINIVIIFKTVCNYNSLRMRFSVNKHGDLLENQNIFFLEFGREVRPVCHCSQCLLTVILRNHSMMLRMKLLLRKILFYLLRNGYDQKIDVISHSVFCYSVKSWKCLQQVGLVLDESDTETDPTNTRMRMESAEISRHLSMVMLY
jgi:hypothetical protein